MYNIIKQIDMCKNLLFLPPLVVRHSIISTGQTRQGVPMEIRNLRCGRRKETGRIYSDDKIVEAMIVDPDGIIRFISLSSCRRGSDIFVSRASLFDILLHVYDTGVDHEEESCVIDSVADEQYFVPEGGGLTEEIKDSVYLKAISFCMDAARDLFGTSVPDENAVNKYLESRMD